MSKGAEKFMIEEYKQITQAFIALHTQKNQLLRHYLTLMTVGSTALGVASQALPIIFPKIKIEVSTGLVGGFILLLAIVGFIILNSIIGVRHDMLTYAKTINEIRGYYAKKNKTIKPHLVLPTTRSLPPFFESPPKYFFWEVTFVGIINSAVLVFALFLMKFMLGLAAIFGVVFTVFQIVWYYWLSSIREREY